LRNKNVLTICRFNYHFGIWLFNGILLKDEFGVLEIVQEGKITAMRHWKFKFEEAIEARNVLLYINGAIELLKSGVTCTQKAKAKIKTKLYISSLLKQELESDSSLNKAFYNLTPCKKRNIQII
jgi:uncharacterized protein YdeI (YjbR/CyaY-like superfamily)